jgi:hypothetical protein
VWVEALNGIELFDKSIGNAIFEVQIEDFLSEYVFFDEQLVLFVEVRIRLGLACVNQSAVEPLLVDFKHRRFVVW